MPFIPLEVFSNNPSTTVAPSGYQGGASTGGTPASGTVESWTVMSSAGFPVVEIGATQFHVADPAQPSEMITVQNVSGTTWTVIRGAESSATATHAAGAALVQVVTAGVLAALQYPAWQFPVQAYNAQGDGKIGTGGTGNSGQNVFTDAGASFVNATAPAGDVGKVIVVNQGAGGSAQNPFCGTITAVNSATSVTLNANLAATCASAPYIYGTDDAAAITAAVNAAAAWAVSTGNYKAQVVFEPQNYMLAALTQTTSPYDYNCHIPVPVGTQYGRKLVIDFLGVGDASEPDYWESAVPGLQGTCLVSGLFATGQPDGTYGQQSILGGPTGTAGMSPGGFANTLLNVDGITFVAPWNSQQYGVNGINLAQMNVGTASYLAFAPVNYNNQTCGGPYLGTTHIVSNGVSCGFAFPQGGNNDNCNARQMTAEGAAFGFIFQEHFTAQRICTVYCDYGGYCTVGASAVHGASILYWSCESGNWILGCAGTAGGFFAMFIGQMDTESMNTGDVQDANNCLAGIVYWQNGTSMSYPVNTGAANLQMISCKQARGVVGPPSVPATTVAFQSNYWRDATVYITSGGAAVTGIAVGGSATGLTLGTTGTVTVRVRSGATITLTYASTAPTWVWILD